MIGIEKGRTELELKASLEVRRVNNAECGGGELWWVLRLKEYFWQSEDFIHTQLPYATAIR